jgi:VanZ family protein
MATLGRIARAVWRFGPPVALMGLIWWFSSQPDLGTDLGVWDTILRKLAHFTIFGTLFALWLRAFRWRAAPAAFAIAFAWAVIDELHQTMVEGRVGSPIDVGIDTAGILTFWGASILALRRVRRRRTGDAADAARPAPPSDPAAVAGDEDGLGAVDRPELPVDVVEVGADGARRER